MGQPSSGKLGRGVSWRCIGGWYHIRFRSRDRVPSERSIALDTNDYALAMERARRLMQRYELGLDDPWKGNGARDVAWLKALNSFKKDRKDVLEANTLAGYEKVIRDFFQSSSLLGPRHVTRESLQSFVYQPALSQASKANYYRTLRVFFKWCAAHGYVDENPLASVDKPKDYKPIPKGLRASELDRLLIAHDTWFESNEYIRVHEPNEGWAKDGFELMAWTGLRPKEAKALRWTDVFMPDGRNPGYFLLRSRTRKGAKGRTKGGSDNIKTMLPQAELVLRRLLAKRPQDDPEGYVLRASDGVSSISAEYLYRRFVHFRDEAKLPKDYDLYSLRHTYAGEYIRRGGSLSLLKEEMGHKDIKTTMKYAQLDPRERMNLTLKLFSDEH